MGKKTTKGGSGGTATSGGKAPSSPSGVGKASGGSSVAALMEEAQLILRKLESSATHVDPAECEATTQRLLERYKQISIKNKVDSKREELLQLELAEFQLRNSESTEEIRLLREDYKAKEAKLEKLEKLSKQLSSRLRSVESKVTDDVKEEKESRLKMSYDFSSTIKDISHKLDLLGKKREHIVMENSRLKQILRECLEEFDKDQEQQRALEAKEKEEGCAGDEGSRTEALAAADAKLPPGSDVDVERERQLMEIEDDISRIVLLRSKEDLLKSHTIRFMEIFDSFQVRLTKSNHLFQVKQTAVEDMTKRIKGLEKSNQQIAAHITECSLSTKSMLESVEKLRGEKAKYERTASKHRALIEKFQLDIATMERGATSSTN